MFDDVHRRTDGETLLPRVGKTIVPGRVEDAVAKRRGKVPHGWPTLLTPRQTPAGERDLGIEMKFQLRGGEEVRAALSEGART